MSFHGCPSVEYNGLNMFWIEERVATPLNAATLTPKIRSTAHPFTFTLIEFDYGKRCLLDGRSLGRGPSRMARWTRSCFGIGCVNSCPRRICGQENHLLGVRWRSAGFAGRTWHRSCSPAHSPKWILLNLWTRNCRVSWLMISDAPGSQDFCANQRAYYSSKSSFCTPLAPILFG